MRIDKKHRPEIDGLRALAVISVMVYHAGIGVLPGGYIGVDIFFVISGFLITTIIHRELQENRFSLMTFYERRMRRIFPALFVMMAISALFAWVLLTPNQLKNFGQSILATSVFLSNVYFYFKTGYFDQRAEEIPMLHTWSLSVEEQYYIIFPFILMAVAAFRPKILNAMLIVLLVISFYFSVLFQIDKPSFNFFLLPTRGWELLVGALLAIQFKALRPIMLTKVKLSFGLELIGLVAVVTPLFLLTGESPFPGVNAVPVVFGTALLILCMHPQSIVGKVFSHRIIVGLGLISYSAYLIHQPLFVFVKIAYHNISLFGLFGLIVMTFMLAYLSWRFIETPFRNKEIISKKMIFSGGILVMIGFSILGFSAHFYGGMPQRFDRATLTLAKTAQQSPYRASCHTDGIEYLKPEKACSYFSGKTTWAVFGDSHTVEIANELAVLLKPFNRAVKHLSFSGCPPTLDFAINNPGCLEWTKEAVDYLENAEDISNILIVYRHSNHLFGDQVADFPKIPKKAPIFLTDGPAELARDAYWRNLMEIVARLRSAGKKVYILNPIPELQKHIDRMIFGGEFDIENQNVVGAPLSFYKQRNAKIIPEIEKIADKTNSIVVNTTNSLCNEKSCMAISAGHALYFDDNHLSLAGAKLILEASVADGQLILNEGD